MGGEGRIGTYDPYTSDVRSEHVRGSKRKSMKSMRMMGARTPTGFRIVRLFNAFSSH